MAGADERQGGHGWFSRALQARVSGVGNVKDAFFGLLRAVSHCVLSCLPGLAGTILGYAGRLLRASALAVRLEMDLVARSSRNVEHQGRNRRFRRTSGLRTFDADVQESKLLAAERAFQVGFCVGGIYDGKPAVAQSGDEPRRSDPGETLDAFAAVGSLGHADIQSGQRLEAFR